MNTQTLRPIWGRLHIVFRQIALTFVSLLVFWGLSQPSMGSTRTENLNPQMVSKCYAAIARASQQMGVPQDVMHAISLTETGKMIGGKVSPWPWTVNMEGAGLWFATRAEALAYVNAHFARGARSFDVGCFQINYKWHHQHFRSISDMFDPDINAMYAAKYLRELYQETGSWMTAAAYYHSRTPEFAKRYSERFASHLARITGGGGPVLAGHGSEALVLAEPGTVETRTPPAWPLAELGKLPPTEIISSRPTGSLVRLDGGPSLLIPTTRPMF